MHQGLEEEGGDADDLHGAKERTPRIYLPLHKGLVGETGHADIESVGPMGDDANGIKCTLDALKGHCKPKSN